MNKIKIPSIYRYSLEKRFSYDNAVREEGAGFVFIPHSCPLCEEYAETYCRGCPLHSEGGCRKLILSIVGKELYDSVFLSQEDVSWTADNDEKARRFFSLLREAVEWI